jgi:hypothetical protein
MLESGQFLHIFGRFIMKSSEKLIDFKGGGRFYLSVVAASATLAISVPFSANALTLLPNPTIIASAPAFPEFEVGFALDNNFTTDYASFGEGVNTFIDFDFGSPVLISQVNYTDRVTSGAGQGDPAGGEFDNVTDFDLIFSSDSEFLTPPDTTVSVPSPGFANTDIVLINGGAGIIARYLRWDVTSTSGDNPGSAEFQFFTSTPEPSNLLGYIALGGLILASAVKKPRQ